MMVQDTKWIVMKFGGTSVSSRENWETIAAAVSAHLSDGLRPVVVCSALSGVSDGLEALFSREIDEQARTTLAQIIDRHRALGAELGLDADSLLGADFEELDRLAPGAELVGEISPRLQARVMAFGELMSTRLGTAFLNSKGIGTAFLDAREILRAEVPREVGHVHHFLSASCHHDPDEEIRAHLASFPEPVILTQGFIARDAKGKTVLLGRGGSDTSAAYISSILGAEQCEIWTDVPGLYSADPRHLPDARLLLRLDYQEVQEIASMGAKVLHPRCIQPLARADIPVSVRCTPHPDLVGTVISSDAPLAGGQVKAISSKYGLTVISMESMGMWHQVGFLNDVTGCFKKHGLSIDLVSTSETNVTVSLDPLAGALDPAAVDALIADLGAFCEAKKIFPCASISLVGRGIRAILHQLGPALEVFEESMIHLVSQAANDLNLTFVIDEQQVERLVLRLHQILFARAKNKSLLGPTWAEVFDKETDRAQRAAKPWWETRRDDLLSLADEGTPAFVYDEATLRESAEAVSAMASVDRIFYSIKANPFPPILKLFENAGLGFECVSAGELAHVLSVLPDIDRSRILFTPNFAPREEYEQALSAGVFVTLDNLHPLAHWPELFRGKEVLVRIDPGQGRGHHDFVKTAGAHSKFGVTIDQFDRLCELAAANNTRIVGLHAHTGSGILIPGNWENNAMLLASMAESLPDVKYLDLGGGLGVVEKPGQAMLDLSAVNEGLARIKAAYPDLELWLEPGRRLAATAGVLLARVTQLKEKGDYRYVGTDVGMNTLIRPALYGSFHQIVNLTRLNEKGKVEVEIVGPICESGDVLGHDRRIVRPQEGDIVLIATTGAYGRAMSSNYNLRAPAMEKMLAR